MRESLQDSDPCEDALSARPDKDKIIIIHKRSTTRDRSRSSSADGKAFGINNQICVGACDGLGRAGGKAKFGPITSCYLVTYNLVNSVGWGYVLLSIILGALTDGWDSLHQTWANLSAVVWRLQILVILDVAHAFLGLWGPHPTLPLHRRIWCKVGHRTELFVTVFLVGDKIASSVSWAPMLLTWALADVFRHQYYASSVVGLKYRWLSWIRYSMFLVQWPFNLVSEVSFVAVAFPHLLASGLGQSPLLSYAWVAIAFQLRNIMIFLPGMQKLYEARSLRLKLENN